MQHCSKALNRTAAGLANAGASDGARPGIVNSDSPSVRATSAFDEPPDEGFVAQQLRKYASCSPRNEEAIRQLDGLAFGTQVLIGELSSLAIDSGDSVQPIYKQVHGVWLLSAWEVLYRFHSCDSVPYPAFVRFVQAASDQSASPDPVLRAIFQSHAVSSLQRVDARLSLLDCRLHSKMEAWGLLTSLNFTAKQLEIAVAQPLRNPKLLALEETEYDEEPANLSALRIKAWQIFGMLPLDDVQPTLTEVEEHAASPFTFSPPKTPAGHPFKPLGTCYRHNLAFARKFIRDFSQARSTNPQARGSLKLSEVFCVYLIGVGYAPDSRDFMAAWREANPEAHAAVRAAGVQLIRDALNAGMDVCFEVSFDDSEVEWLLKCVPELEGRMLKQGGLSGPVALPHSMVEREIF